MTLRRYLLAFVAAATLLPLAACGSQRASAQAGAAAMPSFSSDAELRAFLKAHRRQDRAVTYSDSAVAVELAPPPSEAAGDASAAAAVAADAPATSAREAENPGITNNQVQGVDEGGIVKVSGDYLVILRRGRLFTVSTAGGGLKPAGSIDAYPPGVDPSSDWYDEMLVSGNLVVVIGYSYGRGGTEVNRFRIGADGQLSFQDSYHLRSNDYYSDRNYASRLVGHTLVVYTPLYINEREPFDSLPAVSQWRPGHEQSPFRRLANSRQVFVPKPIKQGAKIDIEAMHSVSRCDLTAPVLDCDATVVLGASGRNFYVAQDAVYIWVGPAYQAKPGQTWVYRMPLDGSAPTAVRAEGAPVDQFSFNLRTDRRRLDVLVSQEGGGGDAMWAPEFAGGKPALLHLPLSRFGDGSATAPQSDYQSLPGGEELHIGHDRFVGDHLLYTLTSWGERVVGRLVIAPVDGGRATELTLPWDINRIEQLGRDALAVGGSGATVFQTIDLTGSRPALGSTFVQPNSSEAESRSHGFFFRPDPGSRDDGLLGLPVLIREDDKWAAQMLFLRRSNRTLGDFGLLSAGKIRQGEDGCRASCVDWYGDARPIFLRGRVFALLGYELVEGDASGARIRETRRVRLFAAAGRRPLTSPAFSDLRQFGSGNRLRSF